MTDVSKRIAVTGGHSGIGRAVVECYLRQGHRVAVLSRHGDLSDALEREYPNHYLSYRGDVGVVKDLEAFYHMCASQWGGLDIVVANAGVAVAEALVEVNEASFQHTFDINVKGVFFSVQKALPYLKQGSAITLVSSIQANKGAGVWAAYGASKAAVRSLARSFAAELGHQGIRVNCLSPGVTETPIFQKFGFDESTLSAILQQVKVNTPLGRLGTPEEIARAIVFINSEQASFITGADIHVDGGLAQI